MRKWALEYTKVVKAANKVEKGAVESIDEEGLKETALLEVVEEVVASVPLAVVVERLDLVAAKEDLLVAERFRVFSELDELLGLLFAFLAAEGVLAHDGLVMEALFFWANSLDGVAALENRLFLNQDPAFLQQLLFN